MRYADCSGLKLTDASRCGLRRNSTRRSTNLETVDKFEIGRYFAESAQSSPCFLSNGETCAILNPRGKLPSYNAKFAILVTTGANTSAQRFNSETGQISCVDDFAGILLMSCSTSSSETEPKTVQDRSCMTTMLAKHDRYGGC